MTTLSYTVPVAGTTLNSVADPEVATALTSILTWSDEIDTGNLSATAGIIRSQLAGGWGDLALSIVSTDTSAADGNLYQVNATGKTITLPDATLNQTIGVWNASGTGASPTTVTASSGSIVALGAGGGVSSIVLGAPGAFVILQGNGSNWIIASGQQDSGWIAVSDFGTNVAADVSPKYRLQGDRVWLTGSMINSGGSVNASAAWFTLPTGYQPPVVVVVPATGLFMAGSTESGNLALYAKINTDGVYSIASTTSTNSIVGLDGISFSMT